VAEVGSTSQTARATQPTDNSDTVHQTLQEEEDCRQSAEFNSLVVGRQCEAVRHEQILGHQRRAAAATFIVISDAAESDASERRSQHHFHCVAVLFVVGEVELVFTDHGQIVQAAISRKAYLATNTQGPPDGTGGTRPLQIWRT